MQSYLMIMFSDCIFLNHADFLVSRSTIYIYIYIRGAVKSDSHFFLTPRFWLFV